MTTHRAYIRESPTSGLKEVTLPTPVPQNGQVLVSVHATRIVHYLHAALTASGPPVVYPYVPGSGCIGRIQSVGLPNSTSLRPGQLVYCDLTVYSRTDPTLNTAILHGFMSGISEESTALFGEEYRNGAFAERVVFPIENVHVLDEETLLQKKGYTKPMLTRITSLLVAVGGLDRAKIQAGETVLVAPATGSFGGYAVVAALAMGAGKVVALGRDKAGLSVLEGLDSRVVGVDITSTTALSEALGDSGVDIYIDFSPGVAEGSPHIGACFDSVRPGGRVVLMGGIAGDVSFNYSQLMLKGITVFGQFMYSREAVKRVLKMIYGGLLDLAALGVVETFTWEDLDKAIEEAKKYGRLMGTVVFTPVLEE
jgi:threonine dehydrogenase-like Zn-dependent dehydrogenase